LASVSLFAQNIDSLERRLHEKISDKQKLDIYITLNGKLATQNSTKAIQFSKEAIALAASVKDSVKLGHLYTISGEAHYFKGNYDTAGKYFYTAISILVHKDKALTALTFNNLAKLYRKIKELDRAITYYDRAMELYSSINDSFGMQMIWNESGVPFEYKGDYTEALRRYRKSMDIALARKDRQGEGYSLSNIAGIYTIQKNYKEALRYMEQVIAIRKEQKDTFALALTYSDMGTIYASMKQFDDAVKSLDTSNHLGTLLQYPSLVANNYKLLSDIYKAQGNFDLALQYFERSTMLKDSVFNIEKSKQTEELNTIYETGKKEQQIAVQEIAISRRNYIIAGISVILLLGGFLGMSVHRRNKMKQEVRLQEAILCQQKLASKAILEAEENERQRIGQDLHDGIGQMMSAAKINLSAFLSDIPTPTEAEQIRADNILSLIDESCKEVRAVSHSMMPNALLKAGLASAVREFINRIDGKVLEVNLYTEGLDERLDTTVETVLYRVIQECVNNVIKHAGAGRLDISIIKDEDGLSATIEDNGKGFDTSDMSIRNGIGLKNIESRIQYLKGELTIDSSPGHGTATIITIAPEHLNKS
jgi:signal transduction histidine kinase